MFASRLIIPTHIRPNNCPTTFYAFNGFSGRPCEAFLQSPLDICFTKHRKPKIASPKSLTRTNPTQNFSRSPKRTINFILISFCDRFCTGERHVERKSIFQSNVCLIFPSPPPIMQRQHTFNSQFESPLPFQMLLPVDSFFLLLCHTIALCRRNGKVSNHNTRKQEETEEKINYL